ncbi:DUF2255 family protein [Angustibacter aerolatus]
MPAQPGWSPDELAAVDAAHELLIAAQRPDGRWRQAVPIWVVTVGEDVVVRSWHRRDTGWFGDAVRTGRARVDVPGLSTDVVVADVGADDQLLRDAVDAAYRARYGPAGAASMVTDAAAATTLRLLPVRGRS